jgi:hypothetical protein
VLVALSSSPRTVCAGEDGLQALYKGSGADLATLHFERRPLAIVGRWNLLRQPWDLPRCDGTPALVSNNEPVGPQSTIASLDDPLVLTMLAFVSYGAGLGSFVMHAGPGVRGGGAADLSLGRKSNLWEAPRIEAIANGLQALERLLPPDFANWRKEDWSQPSMPRPADFSDASAVSAVYCFSKAATVFCGAAGITRPVDLIARRSMTIASYHPLDGRLLAERKVTQGQRFGLGADPAAVILKIGYW